MAGITPLQQFKAILKAVGIGFIEVADPEKLATSGTEYCPVKKVAWDDELKVISMDSQEEWARGAASAKDQKEIQHQINQACYILCLNVSTTIPARTSRRFCFSVDGAFLFSVERIPAVTNRTKGEVSWVQHYCGHGVDGSALTPKPPHKPAKGGMVSRALKGIFGPVDSHEIVVPLTPNFTYTAEGGLPVNVDNITSEFEGASELNDFDDFNDFEFLEDDDEPKPI